MTRAQAARFLIERLPVLLAEAGRNGGFSARDYFLSLPRAHPAKPPASKDQKIAVLANRMFLQIFSVPSLQAHLADAAVIPAGTPDGKVKIQLDFLKLPKEVLPDLERLLSTDFFKDHRLVKYIKNGQARTGLEIEVTPKDLPGDDYNYAF
jgi:hypothetical protein